jgi:phosphocarrier protein
MKQTKIVIKNKKGLHTRAASLLTSYTAKFFSDITIIKNGHQVDGKSIIGILTLAAAKGSELLIKAEGQDENEAISKVVELVDMKFGEA